VAIIKANMKRPNDIDILNSIDLSPSNQKISTAEELLEKCEIKSFPVDLNKILNYLGIKLEEKNLSNDISGEICLKTNELYIEKKHPKARKNFTIAHELGHFCLHQDINDKFEDQIFFRGAVSDVLEFQANNFASELLMPEREFLDKIKSGMNTIQKLSEYFGVSTLAIRVRAKQLNITGHGL